jgi:hypothetical protein
VNGRIVHTVTSTVRASHNAQQRSACGTYVKDSECGDLLRILARHEALLERARRLIAFWRVSARRCGGVRDIRVSIVKMLWEEAWWLSRAI